MKSLFLLLPFMFCSFIQAETPPDARRGEPPSDLSEKAKKQLALPVHQYKDCTYIEGTQMIIAPSSDNEHINCKYHHQRTLVTYPPACTKVFGPKCIARVTCLNPYADSTIACLAVKGACPKDAMDCVTDPNIVIARPSSPPLPSSDDSRRSKGAEKSSRGVR